MNYQLIESLREYPIIDRNTLRKRFGYTKEYSSLVLQRLEKRGIVTRLIKGKYTMEYNSYKVASNLYSPGYISFLTASMLKGCTEQIITTVQVACNYSKKFEFKTEHVELIKLKKDNLFGFHSEDGVFIADNEKLILDMLLYRKHSGNFNEIIKVANGLEFDIQKLLSYLRKIEDNSLIKRVCYLLEKYKNIDLHNEVNLDNNYCYLDEFGIKKDEKNSRWRIWL